MIELADLPLFWQCRAKALSILNEVNPDQHTTGVIETYEECVEELRAALDKERKS